SSAMLNIGLMYLAGDGVRQSLPSATRWHLRAARNGNLGAMRALVRIYSGQESRGGDKQLAVRWLARVKAREAAQQEQKAALRGNARACRSLAGRFRNGDGVRKSATAARFWAGSARRKRPAPKSR